MLHNYLSVAGLSSIAFGLFCFLFVLINSIKLGRVTFLGWSILFFGLIYGISSPLIIESIVTSPESFIGSSFIISNDGRHSIHTIAAFLSAVGVIFGWGLASRVSAGRKSNISPLFQSLTAKNKYNRVFWTMLLIAFVAQYLYAIDYGGLKGVSDYSRLVRSNLFDSFERSRFSFLSPFAGFSLISTFGFLGLLLSKYRRFTVIFGFVFSLIFALYVLYTWQGRLGIVTFIAIIFLSIILMRNVNPILLILSFFGVAIGGMYLVFFVSELWELKTSDSFGSFYTKEISFVFTGFWAEYTASDNTFRLFYDLLVLPLFLLPSSLTQGWFENVMNVHTATLMGAPKGEAGVTSAMPIDIVTMGYLQLEFVGVIIYASLFGILLKSLQTMVDNIELPGIKAVFTAYIALKICGFALFYAHPEQLIGSNFPLIVSIILLFFIRKLTTVKPNKYSL